MKKTKVCRLMQQKGNETLRRKRITIRLLMWCAIILLSLALLILVLYFGGREVIAISLCIWLLLVIFCVYKIHALFRSRIFFRKGEWTVQDIDDISGIDFEHLTCDILATNGFDIAESTQATADFGVDVLARRDGITYAIQCKRHQSPVGIEAVQQVYAGRAYYECHVAVVFTNQYFTANAKKLADKLGVVLWDRDVLENLL